MRILKKSNEKVGYMCVPVEDANDTVLAGEGDHAVIGGPGGLDFTKAADFWRETEDLRGKLHIQLRCC